MKRSGVVASSLAGLLGLSLIFPSAALAHGGHYCGEGAHKTSPVTRERFVGSNYGSRWQDHVYQRQFISTFGWINYGKKFHRWCPND